MDKKRAEVRRKQNSSKRSMVRTFIKRVLKAIKLKNYKLSMDEFYKAQSVIDKNIISKRKSARIKSRLNLKIKREFKGYKVIRL